MEGWGKGSDVEDGWAGAKCVVKTKLIMSSHCPASTTRALFVWSRLQNYKWSVEITVYHALRWPEKNPDFAVRVMATLRWIAAKEAEVEKDWRENAETCPATFHCSRDAEMLLEEFFFFATRDSSKAKIQMKIINNSSRKSVRFRLKFSHHLRLSLPINYWSKVKNIFFLFVWICCCLSVLFSVHSTHFQLLWPSFF